MCPLKWRCGGSSKRWPCRAASDCVGERPRGTAEMSAKTWDLILDMSRAWARGKWHLGVGPVAGYTWVHRGIYQEPASGFLAGGSVVLSREMARSLEIGLDTSATWSLVVSPPFNDGTRDTDERAVGRRFRVGVGITYWWSDT